MRVSRWMLVGGTAAIVAAVAITGSLGVSKAPAAEKAPFRAALISDVGGFNDNGFNKNQLVGMKRAIADLGGQYFALLSHTFSDYDPNYHTAVEVDKANIVIAAGFLLGGTMKTWAHDHPGTRFAITDQPATAVGGYKNEMGITYATPQAGCLVGVLAAKKAQQMGHKVIGAVGGIPIPPVYTWIAGYKFCAQKAVPGTQVVVQYSNDFVNQAACATLAQNEIQIQHAQVVFQVAGLCGDGALKKAAQLGKWGVGVDADEYNVAPGHILTSALKKTDVGVYKVIHNAFNAWKGGTNIKLDLKNGGVGVGRISPAVPAAWITLMKSYKQKIVTQALIPPGKCSPHPDCT